MSRENAHAKGARYLAEGRLTIEDVGPNVIRASCRGSGCVHDVGWTPEHGWTCSCPALGRCAHLVALMSVTVREGLA